MALVSFRFAALDAKDSFCIDKLSLQKRHMKMGGFCIAAAVIQSYSSGDDFEAGERSITLRLT
jgi:hypothetical protein